jgi:AcrR family transcriptional regulator
LRIDFARPAAAGSPRPWPDPLAQAWRIAVKDDDGMLPRRRPAMSKFPLPPATSRRERRKREVRERIIDAGMELFVEQGCESTTVEQICTRADIARKTFYGYFSSKQQLVQALSETLIFEETRRLVQAARDHSTDTLTRLCFYIDASANNFRNMAALERELIRQAMKDVAVDSERAAQRWPLMADLLTALIEEGQARGDITSDHGARFIGELIAASLYAASVSWVYDPNYPIGQRFLELQRFLGVVLAVPAAVDSAPQATG